MDETDPDESEIEHADDTDVDENDPDKREREHTNGTDVDETELGETEMILMCRKLLFG